MRQFTRTGRGEEHAVIGAQPSDLAFEVRALLQEAAGFVDKSIPDIDIGDAGLARGVAIQRIQEQRVRHRLGAAHRGQAHPQHRHSLGFHDTDHLFDLLGVELDPAFLAEFVKAVGRARALLRRDDRRHIAVVGGVVRGQLGIDRLVIRLRRGIGRAVGFRCRFRIRGFDLGVLLVSLLVCRLVVGLICGRLAHRHAIVEPEHDHDGVGLLGGEDALGGSGPVGRIAPGLVFDQAGDGLVLADHAHIRLFGIGGLETVSEPVRHAVAEHQDVALGHRLALFRRRRLRKVLNNPARRRLLEWREQVAAEPAAAVVARRRACRSAEIKKLRRGRADDSDQQGDRDGQRDQRAAFGEHP